MKYKIVLVILVARLPTSPVPPPKPEKKNDWISKILSLFGYAQLLPVETKVWLIDHIHHWLPWTHWLF